MELTPTQIARLTLDLARILDEHPEEPLSFRQEHAGNRIALHAYTAYQAEPNEWPRSIIVMIVDTAESTDEAITIPNGGGGVIARFKVMNLAMLAIDIYALLLADYLEQHPGFTQAVRPMRAVMPGYADDIPEDERPIDSQAWAFLKRAFAHGKIELYWMTNGTIAAKLPSEEQRWLTPVRSLSGEEVFGILLKR